jgi:hypothetical protein
MGAGDGASLTSRHSHRLDPTQRIDSDQNGSLTRKPDNRALCASSIEWLPFILIVLHPQRPRLIHAVLTIVHKSCYCYLILINSYLYLYMRRLLMMTMMYTQCVPILSSAFLASGGALESVATSHGLITPLERRIWQVGRVVRPAPKFGRTVIQCVL